jgi:peptidylprolyl isomerase
MRRLTAALLAPIAVTAVVLAGCSSTPAATGSNESVQVSGTEGKAPTVHIPARQADPHLVTKTLVHGHGQKLTGGESFLANFDVYVWRGKTSKLLFSSFSSAPQVLPVKIGLSGLQQAVTGARVGSRVLAVLPPKYGYGAQGNPQIHVTGTDTLVWVIDLLHAFPANASATGAHITNGGGSLPLISVGPGGVPQVSVPKTAPPSKLIAKTLIKGTGAPVKAGQSIVARYVLSIWRTRTVINSNWPSTTQPTAPPTVFKLGSLIPAWNTALVGVPVGSRVMLVVPPAEGYGAKGSPQAGIKGTDTLVFVIDVLAATG